jgi:hypothetical protein
MVHDFSSLQVCLPVETLSMCNLIRATFDLLDLLDHLCRVPYCQLRKYRSESDVQVALYFFSTDDIGKSSGVQKLLSDKDVA